MPWRRDGAEAGLATVGQVMTGQGKTSQIAPARGSSADADAGRATQKPAAHAALRSRTCCRLGGF
jgi:hypothetical protein